MISSNHVLSANRLLELKEIRVQDIDNMVFSTSSSARSWLSTGSPATWKTSPCGSTSSILDKIIGFRAFAAAEVAALVRLGAVFFRAGVLTRSMMGLQMLRVKRRDKAVSRTLALDHPRYSRGSLLGR